MKNNKKNTLFVVSSFPIKQETHGKYVVGIASYTKNTLRAILSHNKDVSITVLAEELKNSKKKYNDQGITVERVWKRNSFWAIPNLIKTLIQRRHDYEKILIEFELAMFGSPLQLLLFPFLLIALKLMKKNVTMVFHQVVPNIKLLAGHVNISHESFTTDLINGALYSYYFLLLRLITQAIVFEKELKKVLSQFSPNTEIIVIPHGIENFDRVSKSSAREKLGIPKNAFVILTFGFIAWYKGTDLIVTAFKNFGPKMKKNSLLIVGGGPNPNHLNKPYYQDYIEKVTNQKNGIVKVTGFVPENKISLYFKSADAVIFPYRTFMSSSGPLSIAYSLQRPFFISKTLEPLIYTEDFQSILKKLRLSHKNFVFSTNEELEKMLLSLRKNATLRKKLEKIAKEMSTARSWNAIGKRYYEEVISKNS